MLSTASDATVMLQVSLQKHFSGGSGLPLQQALHPPREGTGKVPESALSADHQPAQELLGKGRDRPMCSIPAHRCEGEASRLCLLSKDSIMDLSVGSYCLDGKGSSG